MNIKYIVMCCSLACAAAPMWGQAQDSINIANPKATVQLPNGTVTRDRLVGAVDVVESKTIEHSSSIHLRNALIGQVMGLQAYDGWGDAGRDHGSWSVRGSSRKENAGPLVVIDGIPGRSVNQVAPEDIERVEVLKDVTAKILYGSKAANGVVVITTKRGREEARKITFNAEFGVKRSIATPDYIGSQEYATMYNQARANDGLDPFYSDEQLAGYADQAGSILYPNVDFYDTFLDDQAIYHRENMNVTGGSNGVNYFLSIGHSRENGLEKVGDARQYDRLHVRSNLDYALNDYIRLSLDITGRFDTWEGSRMKTEDFMKALSSHRPNDYPLFVSEEVDEHQFGWSSRRDTNLYGELTRRGYQDDQQTLAQTNIGAFFTLDKWVPGLTGRVVGAFDVYNTISKGKNLEYSRVRPEDGVRVGTDVLKGSEQKFSDNFYRTVAGSAQLNYNRTFGRHAVQADLMYRLEKKSVKTVLSGPSSTQDDRHMNMGLRLNYAYDNRYVVEGNVSRMGSDKFTSDNRWGLFGAAGVAYNIHNEAYMQDVDWVDYLKVKASYGLMGYDNSFDYLLYRSLYKANGFFQTGPHNEKIEYGLKLDKLGNPDLTFEKSRELNIGLEARFLNNRLSVSGNYFYEYRYDIPVLIQNQLPDYVGGAKPMSNSNEISNRGFELAIGYQNSYKDLHYSVQGILSYSEAKYEKYDELNDYDNLNQTGQVIDNIRGYYSDGLYRSQEDIDNHGVSSTLGGVIPGDLKYRDMNGDNTIDATDKYVIGHNKPRYYYGFNADLQYKNWEFYCSIQGVADRDIMLSNSYFWPKGDNKYSTRARMAATPATLATAQYPRLTTVNNSHSYQNSTFWLADGSYVKLRNIELAYTLPKDWSGQLAAQGLKVFVRGENLLSLDDLDKLDASNPNAGVTVGPMMKSVSVGLKLIY